MHAGALWLMVIGLMLTACSDGHLHRFASSQSNEIPSSCKPSSSDERCRGRMVSSRPSVREAQTVATTSSVAPAVSGSVPVIDVEQVCDGIARQGGSTLYDRGIQEAKQHCLKTEQETRDELVRSWKTFLLADQSHCVSESKMGGESSYTELLTCLEMAQAVRKLHEEPDLDQTEHKENERLLGQR